MIILTMKFNVVPYSVGLKLGWDGYRFRNTNSKIPRNRESLDRS